MEAEYNSVNMQLLTLDRVSRTAIYSPDQMDLLYVEWILGMSCVFARGGYPVATSAKNVSQVTLDELKGAFANGGIRGADPQITAWGQTSNVAGDSFDAANGIVTDAEARTRLWVPRRKLKISGYDSDGNKVVWLESPRGTATCDAANGPHPLSVDVVEATGDAGTLGIHFQVRTCVPPCPAGSDRLILSHRWEMTHAHNDDFYLTRTIRGEVVFNGAVVNKNDLRPDLFRNQFMHPIPLGFRRAGPQITQSSDGLTIHYTLVDTDPTVVFDPGDSGATQMEIVEKIAYESPWGL